MTAPSRKIEDLCPAMQPLCRQFQADCKAAGVPVLITCTWRSYACQAELYAQGRTQAQLDAAGVRATAQPGKPKVTNAKPGQSKHEVTLNGKPYSKAFDFVPLDARGAAIWDAKNPAWAKCGAIAQRLGLDWGGAWTSFKDMPHCQLKA